MKIKHILDIYTMWSKNGHSECALKYKATSTGKEAWLKVDGGEGNARSVIFALNRSSDRSDQYRFRHETVTRLSAKEFHSLTRDWPCGGSTRESLAKEIKKQLHEQKARP